MPLSKSFISIILVNIFYTFNTSLSQSLILKINTYEGGQGAVFLSIVLLQGTHPLCVSQLYATLDLPPRFIDLIQWFADCYFILSHSCSIVDKIINKVTMLCEK